MKRFGVYFASIVLTIVLVMCIASSSALKTSAGEKKKSRECFYESIQIHAGDTLWSIAKEYKSSDESVADYVEQLKLINGLDDDEINADNYLIVYHSIE